MGLTQRVAAGTLVLFAAAGCGLGTAAPRGSARVVEVVAGENSWGSIAAQLGGEHVHVTSIISNPATDPHAYEAKPADARAIAAARYVIVNGAGYDPWMPRLLDANPVAGRLVLNIGDMLGKKPGDNPHFWYSPVYVERVVDRIAADLEKLDGADGAYFARAAASYKSTGLKDYEDACAAIAAKYRGAPVGATESIFAYLAQDCGLVVVTPPGYMKAVSEGGDPSAADKVTLARQVAQRQVRVLVFNSQNTTPDVGAVVDQARAARIPVVAVTETLAPASATFQDWQTGQLKAILGALGG